MAARSQAKHRPVLGPVGQLRSVAEYGSQLRGQELELGAVGSLAPQRAVDVEDRHPLLQGQHLGAVEEDLDSLACRSRPP